ncbi:hypothetical protein [Amycolatopsis sp. CA-128772]|uniref:hypothetical protein n=1 Tax=Amycolatopsis sp. CA-128772 TaxID=2073159 RepID=UPI0011B0AA99|nr:hypothetical protein [Amycolatopsis sp. CA-128772]
MKIAVGSAVAALVATAVVVPSVLPTSAEDYRSAALTAAEQSLSQVRTTELMVTADIDGKVLPPYRSSVLWQARDALATAADDFTAEQIPDTASISLHDECAPLLTEASAEIAAVTAAADVSPDDERAMATRLHKTGELLAGFLERHR